MRAFAATAECPIHGRQPFVRDERRAWWMCLRDEGYPWSCGSVIPDEMVTADGAEVCTLNRLVGP